MFFNREKIKKECIEECQSLKELASLKCMIKLLKEEENQDANPTINSSENVKYGQHKNWSYQHGHPN